MIIKLSPQRREDTLYVVKQGDSLTVNGEVFDFSPLPDNSTLPVSAINSEWFTDDVIRVGGEITVTLLFPIPENYSQEQAFPDDIVNVEDGTVTLPKPAEEFYNEY